MKEVNKKQEPYTKFKKFLFENNIKQKELAKSLGKSHSFVNNVLNGRGARFTLADFIKIRCSYNIKIHEYF